MSHTTTPDQLSRSPADRAEITDLIDRYLLSLDDRDFDEARARSVFTDDCEVEYPVGGRQGIAEIVDITRQGVEQFDRTQHVGSNYVIDLHGDDRATLRCNAIMTHVHRVPAGRPPGAGPDPLFTVGGRIKGDLVRTIDGWRFQHVAIHVIWTAGEPPARPGGSPPAAATGRAGADDPGARRAQ
jgi:SnoaL-like protein